MLLVKSSLGKRLVGEALGTALLLAIVVGSGIMGEQLSGGNIAMALLANSLATGAGIVVLILVFQNISGAHFNPAVTLVEFTEGSLSRNETFFYIAVQFIAAIGGVLVAHKMFDLSAFELSSNERSGFSKLFSEFVASFGLLSVICGLSKNNKVALPYAVGFYILAAYWFTSSTSFANPAVTLARAFTSTFTGIRLVDVFPFWGAQLVGAFTARYLFKCLG